MIECAHCGKEKPSQIFRIRILVWSRTGFWRWVPRVTTPVPDEWRIVHQFTTIQKTGEQAYSTTDLCSENCHQRWDKNQAALETIADRVRQEMSWTLARR